MNTVQIVNQAQTNLHFLNKTYTHYYIDQNGTKKSNPYIKIMLIPDISIPQNPTMYACLYNYSTNEILYRADWNDLTARALLMDNMQTSLSATDYRNIKGHSLWREIYKLPRMNKKTWNWQTKAVVEVPSDTLFACRKCGIILEENLIEIDHQRTKTQGHIGIAENRLWGATLKLFRYAGCTIGAATGFKARYYGISGAGGNPADKYKLNSIGEFLFSIIVEHVSDYNLQLAAETAIPNLRPLCPSCNKTVGTPYSGLPWNT